MVDVTLLDDRLILEVADPAGVVARLDRALKHIRTP